MRLATILFVIFLGLIPASALADPITVSAVATPVVATVATPPASPVAAAVPAMAPVVKVAAPETPAEVEGVIQGAIKAARSKQWMIFAGFLITLLVWLATRFNLLAKVPKNTLPWVAVGVGVLSYVGMSLSAGTPWYYALERGLLVGSQGIAFWELAFKHLLKKNGTPPEDKPAVPVCPICPPSPPVNPAV
jgi:hypothetical protein